MSNACPITGEWREAQLAWRQDFVSSYLCQVTGMALVGAPAFANGLVLNGATQYATYNGPALRSIFGATSLYIFIRFTPDFAYNDGNQHQLIDSGPNGRYGLVKANTGELGVFIGGTVIAAIPGATYGASWLVGQENVLTISSVSGDTDVWLNGTQILTSDVSAWTPQPDETTLYIGSSFAGADLFDGTIHEMLLGTATADANEDADYRAKSTISELDESQSVITIPCIGSYVRASDGLQVTPAIGVSGVREVLMGSDGATAAEFPTALFPRGFSFDGGDQLSAGDDDEFSFSPASPFSLALLCLPFGIPAGSSRLVFGKMSTLSAGEYGVYLRTDLTIAAICIDAASVAHSGRRTAVPTTILMGQLVSVSAGYAGGLPTDGCFVFRDSNRIDSVNAAFGVYADMQNTNTALMVGDSPSIGGFIGRMFLTSLRRISTTPFQSRALSARLRLQQQSS